MNSDKEFSIQETVNRNIEKNQFPHFRNHRSLIGWCSMNYPRVLQNPALIEKKPPRPDPEQLELLYQQRIQGRQTSFSFKKPFTNLQLYGQAQKPESLGQPPMGFKASEMTLATTGRATREKILQETNKEIEDYLNFKPISAELGGKRMEENFSRKIRQIGEIQYNLSYENEEVRHLKKLPNSILTEQNLMEIFSPQLKSLNLHNHTWISNDLINKIGYFAVNIEELILSETEITDDVLKELAISCQKLNAIDISNCKKVTDGGVKLFLQLKAPQLRKFKAAHDAHCINDSVLEPLSLATNLEVLDLSFCPNIDDEGIQYIVSSGCKLKELYVSSCEKLKDTFLSQLVVNARETLQIIDLSFNPQKEIARSISKKIGNCANLQQLILTGSQQFNDDQLQQIASGDDEKHKKPDGNFERLSIIKLGGLDSISDGGLQRFLQHCPNVTYLELNHLRRLTDYVLQALAKQFSELQKVMLNFTPEITDEGLQEAGKQNPRIQFVRNIKKETDPKDDGLRMPYPHESKLKVKKAKKKKKK